MYKYLQFTQSDDKKMYIIIQIGFSHSQNRFYFSNIIVYQLKFRVFYLFHVGA